MHNYPSLKRTSVARLDFTSHLVRKKTRKARKARRAVREKHNFAICRPVRALPTQHPIKPAIVGSFPAPAPAPAALTIQPFGRELGFRVWRSHRLPSFAFEFLPSGSAALGHVALRRNRDRGTGRALTSASREGGSPSTPGQMSERQVGREGIDSRGPRAACRRGLASSLFTRVRSPFGLLTHASVFFPASASSLPFSLRCRSAPARRTSRTHPSRRVMQTVTFGLFARQLSRRGYCGYLPAIPLTNKNKHFSSRHFSYAPLMD
jgi:hypothetical protein